MARPLHEPSCQRLSQSAVSGEQISFGEGDELTTDPLQEQIAINISDSKDGKLAPFLPSIHFAGRGITARSSLALSDVIGLDNWLLADASPSGISIETLRIFAQLLFCFLI